MRDRNILISKISIAIIVLLICICFPYQPEAANSLNAHASISKLSITKSGNVLIRPDCSIYLYNNSDTYVEIWRADSNEDEYKKIRTLPTYGEEGFLGDIYDKVPVGETYYYKVRVVNKKSSEYSSFSTPKSIKINSPLTLTERKEVISAGDYEILYSADYGGNGIFNCGFELEMYTNSNSKKAKPKDIYIALYGENSGKLEGFYPSIGGGYLCTEKGWLDSGEHFYIKVYNKSDYSYVINYKIKKYRTYPTSISIPKTLTLKAESNKKLTATSILPTDSIKHIEWSSSNPKIAKIDEHYLNQCLVYGNKPGTCTITAKLRNGRAYKCKVTVTKPPAYINYYAYAMNRNQKVKLKVLYASRKPIWSSSNKKVATISSNGMVTAKDLGKCVITGKVGNKKYVCKITVSRRWANFGAELYDYNTRNNYFVVKYKNKGNYSVYITSGIKVIDVDYKNYDRKVRLTKTVKIKPGQTKYVRFYVIGKNTWWDYEDFTLYYKFRYDGKTYEGHVWDEDSVFKRNKAWYATYWDDDWYYGWLYV